VDVSFYPGCTSHSTGLEYGLSLHAVFGALGIGLKEIDDWNCCGGAAARSLSNLLGLALPARNIAKAQVLDLPLAVPCPGCYNAVKRAQHALESDADMKARLEDVVGFTYKGGLEVKAIHDVLLGDVGIEKIRSAVKKPLAGLRVVSYYGCALVREPEVVGVDEFENPMFLDDIVAALGATPVDWSAKTDCCGADLGMTRGGIARDLADKIAWTALDAEADCIMATCGLCQINLDMKQTGKNGTKIPVMYLTELMGMAMDLPGRDVWWSKHVIGVKPLLRSKGLL
jgi:heterodisulfide reductase subunit B